jgi:hypothetical protein
VPVAAGDVSGVLVRQDEQYVAGCLAHGLTISDGRKGKRVIGGCLRV